MVVRTVACATAAAFSLFDGRHFVGYFYHFACSFVVDVSSAGGAGFVFISLVYF